MPPGPNKLSRFWHELKRRKVTRTITVYAAAAFVILELLSIIIEPLRLPDWTLQFSIVFLCIGFIIAVILSWIYDVHPEEGVVKTEPVDKVKAEDLPKSSNGWKIASYISFIVIVALIVLNVVSRANNNKEILEKSIAVLPFDNMGSDEEYMYLGDAFTDEIIMELQKIEAFDRVLSRTSTMQYAEQRPTIPEIGEKLNVNYIIEGAIQRHKDEVSIRVQVIRAKDEDHVWADEYDRLWEHIFTIQDEIAFKVANELKMVLSPEERQLIEKIPTTNMDAHYKYQIGREAYWNYMNDKNNREALDGAEEAYYKALVYDSAFAQAYTGLAWVYWHKHYWETYFSDNFLDSVLILADIALSFDDQLSDAYAVKGHYYNEYGQSNKAIKEFNRAIKLNPNNWIALQGRGRLYRSLDNIESIRDFHKAISLGRGAELPGLLGDLSLSYAHAGFIDKYEYYIQEIFKMDGDSAKYLAYKTIIAFWNGNYEKGVEYGEKAMTLDSSNIMILEFTGDNYKGLGQYGKSLEYYEKMLERLEAKGSLRINNMHRLGYLYWMNEMKEKAEYYFNLQIEYCDRINELKRESSMQYWTYYDLAAVYAFKGEKEKAFQNLRIFNQQQQISWFMARQIAIDSLFDSLRDEPEFQQIVRDVEAKYQAEHERVRQWLEENDML